MRTTAGAVRGAWGSGSVLLAGPNSKDAAARVSMKNLRVHL